MVKKQTNKCSTNKKKGEVILVYFSVYYKTSECMIPEIYIFTK